MPRALIVWGGWAGHRPKEMAKAVGELLGAEGYDVVVTADYAALGAPDIATERNPKLIYARMTGWGQTGPLAPRAGHDINYLAMGGFLACSEAGTPSNQT